MENIKRMFQEWKWVLVVAMIGLLAVSVWLTGKSLAGAESIGTVGLFSAMIDVIKIPFLVVFMFLSLRLRDRIAGINWKRAKRKIEDDAMSAAIYFSSWVIAIAVIIAAS